MTGWGGRAGGVLGAISTHPTKTTEALQDLAVKEAGAGRVRQGLVQEVVDEVDARLHSEHHAWLQVPSGAQAPQAGLVNPIHALGGVGGWWGEDSEGGTQEGTAPGQGHHLGGRQTETGKCAEHPPLPVQASTRGAWLEPLGSSWSRRRLCDLGGLQPRLRLAGSSTVLHIKPSALCTLP